jgi:aarF domain-containing kinase
MEECENLDQYQRNRLATMIFKLTLEELFHYRYVQTDPNPANFFYDPNREVLHLIDYGAGTISKLYANNL